MSGRNVTDLPPLPVDSFLPKICELLQTNKNLVIVAEPGAGKTSRVPPALLGDLGIVPEGQYIAMLQPRRAAARSTTEWIAYEQGWKVGEEIGYQVRFENRISARTRLHVLTEGVLTRRLLHDPELSQCSAVILDEFHERSLDSELALMLLRETQAAFRPDLGVIVMSATIDAERIAKFLGDCPVIEVPGRTYPIEIEFEQSAAHLPVVQRVSKAVENVLTQTDTGDVLVFLPGTREIRAVENQLQPLVDSGFIPNTEIRKLSGGLTLDDQIKVMKRSPKRRVILSTNVAETSLTIDGIKTVVDSGLVRTAGYDEISGVDTLKVRRISAASARQRSGRAGRTGPGRCIRIWSPQEFLEPFDKPEIERLDLTGFVLSCLSWGWNELERVEWISPPPKGRIEAAMTLLNDLGAVEPETRRLTPLGKVLAQLPVHPRMGRVLLEADWLGDLRLGAEAIAIMTERDFLSDSYAKRLGEQTGHMSDILVRLDCLKNAGQLGGSGLDHESLFRVRQVAGQLEKLMVDLKNRINLSVYAEPQEENTDDLLHDEDARIAKMLLAGFSDRVCRRVKRGSTTAFMARGLGVRVAQTSFEKDSEFFLAIDPRREEATPIGSEPVVRVALGLNRAWIDKWLSPQLKVEKKLEFDDASGRAKVLTKKKLHHLVISESESNASAQEQKSAFESWVYENATELIRLSDGVSPWLARYEKLRDLFPEKNFPEPDLDQAVKGWSSQSRNRAELLSRPALPWLQASLPTDVVRMVNEELPDVLVLPNGRTARIDYETGLPNPLVQARVQDFFGWTESPRLASGRVSILLELLAPNQRPVQRTLDLRSFWINTYPQVRKDLRGRYPKHHWPEDPTTAEAGPSIRKKKES